MTAPHRLRRARDDAIIAERGRWGIPAQEGGAGDSGPCLHAEEDCMKLRALIEPGDPELVATGFRFTEGPVWHPDGFLLFSDIPAGRIYRWTAEAGATVWREPS